MALEPRFERIGALFVSESLVTGKYPGKWHVEASIDESLDDESGWNYEDIALAAIVEHSRWEGCKFTICDHFYLHHITTLRDPESTIRATCS